ncbi:uncharacterized protein LOC143026012 [Oratosquilla oratoria]|uniref:uncharacterized protein LOC143026012 n=1 Tax=Oratosquilla oratoria TaxID=337810 RepID=UPI003F760815
MGEFTIECTLCGGSFGSERDYDAHPCLEDDVKVPFRIKLEPKEDDEEAELEGNLTLATDIAKAVEQEQSASTDNLLLPVKEEPMDVLDFLDQEPLHEEDNDSSSKKEDDEVEDSALNIDEDTHASEETSESLEVQVQNIVSNIPEERVTSAVAIKNECVVCGKRFFRREDCIRHANTAHTVPRPYQCKICRKRFTQKHYVSLHMRVHTGERPYKCKLCPNTYTHKTSYTIHMRIHNGERPYVCDVCGKKCYDKSGLTSHMRSHTKETPYECETCGRRFTHSKSLLVHRRNHTGEKPYKCQYCGKRFRHWHKHKIHIRLHTGERPYKCEICGKGFPRNDEVKRHMRSHTGIKSFKCSICGVYCATQASITGHIDLHHSNLKQNDHELPEKTVVKDSNSGTLGTRAPLPRTIYKPIAPASAAEEKTESSEPISTPTVPKKPAPTFCVKTKPTTELKSQKKMAFKEFMALQEKMLRMHAMQDKNTIKTPRLTSSTSATSTTSTVNNSRVITNTSVAVTNSSIIVPKTSLNFSKGPKKKIVKPLSVANVSQNKQLIFLTQPNSKQVAKLVMTQPNKGAKVMLPQGKTVYTQAGGNRIFLSPQTQGLTPTIQTPQQSQPRIVLKTNTTLNSTVAAGSPTLLGGKQVLLLQHPIAAATPATPATSVASSTTTTPQVMLGQPFLLINGNGGQRLVLLPSQGTAASGTGALGQNFILAQAPAIQTTSGAAASPTWTTVRSKGDSKQASASSGNTNTTTTTTTPIVNVQIKSEPIDPSDLPTTSTSSTSVPISTSNTCSVATKKTLCKAPMVALPAGITIKQECVDIQPRNVVIKTEPPDIDD